jgi:hypothetical protein
MSDLSTNCSTRGVQAIQLLEWWKIPRRGWIIILGELAVIISLGSWVYSEYVNNPYFQIYVNSLSPILVPIISVSFGIISATVATLLYFTMRNIRRRDHSKQEELHTKRGAIKETAKKPQASTSRSKRTSTEAVSLVPKTKTMGFGTASQKRGSDKALKDEEYESG